MDTLIDTELILPVRLVTAADKDVNASSSTLIVELREPSPTGGTPATSFTDVTSSVTVTYINYGEFDIVFPSSVFDTAGIWSLRITVSGGSLDEYRERIVVKDPDTYTAFLAKFSDAEANRIADHILRRQGPTASTSSDGDAQDGTHKFTQTLLGVILSEVGRQDPASGDAATVEFRWEESGTVYGSWTGDAGTTTPTVYYSGGG